MSGAAIAMEEASNTIRSAANLVAEEAMQGFVEGTGKFRQIKL